LSPLGGKEQNFPYSAGNGNSEKTVSAPQYIPVTWDTSVGLGFTLKDLNLRN